MADGVNLPLTGTGDATSKVATDDAGASGHIQLVKLAISADGSAVLIPADLNGLIVQPRLESPQDEILVATALSAGANVDLNATDIPLGKNGRLLGADVGGSVPFRIDLQVINGSRVTRTTVYTKDGMTKIWRPPFGQKFIEVAGGTGIHFGASVTNLSAARTADARITLYWDEVTP
jgi:hypothetical protein